MLLLVCFPPGRGKFSVLRHRLIAHLFNFLVDEHWFVSKSLQIELATKLKIKNWQIRINPGRTGKVERRAHKGFNVLYYDPKDNAYARWVYGIDIIEALQKELTAVNWIRFDSTFRLKESLEVTDVYLRPSRHDGWPRIVDTCRKSSIPVIYSDAFDLTVEKCKKEIKRLYEQAGYDG